MATPTIYRSAEVAFPVLTEAKIAKVLAYFGAWRERTRKVIVREGLIRFLFARDGYNALPVTPMPVLRNTARRVAEAKGNGWAVPESEVAKYDGYSAEDYIAAAENLRLWVKNTLGRAVTGSVPNVDAKPPLTAAEQDRFRKALDGFSILAD